jgi:hypothetical protein
MGHDPYQFDLAFSKEAAAVVRLFGGIDQGQAMVGSRVVQTRSGDTAVCRAWLVMMKLTGTFRRCMEGRDGARIVAW